MNAICKFMSGTRGHVALLLCAVVLQVVNIYDSYRVVVRTDLPVAKHHETLVARR